MTQPPDLSASAAAAAATEDRLHLTGLPVEIQQLIYRHVYPVTDITLIPDDHPGFVPRTLTQEFNLVGCHPVSLLLTCSKVCAVAKPVRDTSLTGRVNVSRAEDLAHCGHWVHHTVRTICLVSSQPVEPLFRLHFTLFANLRSIVLVKNDLVMTLPPVSDHLRAAQYLVANSFDHVFLQEAKSYLDVFFNGVSFLECFFHGFGHTNGGAEKYRTAPATPLLEIDVRIRYSVLDGPSLDSRGSLGAIVRFDADNVDGRVLAKAIRGHDNFRFWEADTAIRSETTDVTTDGVTDPATHSNGLDPNTSSENPVVPETPMPVALNDIPRRYAWIKPELEKIDFDDVE